MVDVGGYQPQHKLQVLSDKVQYDLVVVVHVAHLGDAGAWTRPLRHHGRSFLDSPPVLT